jgi:hypothetical protein
MQGDKPQTPQACTVMFGLAVTEITPPQVHMHLDRFVNVGWPPITTVGDPGVHGDAVAGIHGCGVNTPNAAAVAAAT